MARAAAWAFPVSSVETAPLPLSGGRVLAQTVRATRACPPFDQSAMDGYAVAAGAGLTRGMRLRVTGRIAAGQEGTAVTTDTAARIFTGAPLPHGADAVVMQEHVERLGDAVVLARSIEPGEHVRRRGEDVPAGRILGSPGLRLDARHVALFAAQDIDSVVVRRRIRVAILSTGDELCDAGDISLGGPSIPDTNRPMLAALLTRAGVEVVDGGQVRDDPDTIAEALVALSWTCDLVVTTGGASVGEEDHAARSLIVAGGEGETLKLGLKPGKPAVVGRVGGAAYLGLPGNPVSALVSWSLLGRSILARLEGRPFARPRGFAVPLAGPFTRKPGRTEFLPAKLVLGGDEPALAIVGSTSARLMPLAEADGFAELPETFASGAPGRRVAFHPFESFLTP
ncbi:molybdopterin molybdotransferase MoeA [Methylorubrum aminovorans]